MEHDGEPKVVWVSSLAVRGEPRLATNECPVTGIGAESWKLLEDFQMRRLIGERSRVEELSARQADAFALLATEAAKVGGERDA